VATGEGEEEKQGGEDQWTGPGWIGAAMRDCGDLPFSGPMNGGHSGGGHTAAVAGSSRYIHKTVPPWPNIEGGGVWSFMTCCDPVLLWPGLWWWHLIRGCGTQAQVHQRFPLCSKAR